MRANCVSMLTLSSQGGVERPQHILVSAGVLDFVNVQTKLLRDDAPRRLAARRVGDRLRVTAAWLQLVGGADHRYALLVEQGQKVNSFRAMPARAILRKHNCRITMPTLHPHPAQAQVGEAQGLDDDRPDGGGVPVTAVSVWDQVEHDSGREVRLGIEVDGAEALSIERGLAPLAWHNELMANVLQDDAFLVRFAAYDGHARKCLFGGVLRMSARGEAQMHKACPGQDRGRRVVGRGVRLNGQELVGKRGLRPKAMDNNDPRGGGHELAEQALDLVCAVGHALWVDHLARKGVGGRRMREDGHILCEGLVDGHDWPVANEVAEGLRRQWSRRKRNGAPLRERRGPGRHNDFVRRDADKEVVRQADRLRVLIQLRYNNDAPSSAAPTALASGA